MPGCGRVTAGLSPRRRRSGAARPCRGSPPLPGAGCHRGSAHHPRPAGGRPLRKWRAARPGRGRGGMRRRGGPAGRGQGHGRGGGGSGRGSGPLCRRQPWGVWGAVTRNLPPLRRWRQRAVSEVSAAAVAGWGAAGAAAGPRRPPAGAGRVRDAWGGGPGPRLLFAAGGSAGAKWRPPPSPASLQLDTAGFVPAWPGCPVPGGPPLPEVAFSPPHPLWCKRAVRGRGEPDAPGAASAGSGRGPSGVAASPKPAPGEKYGKGAQRWCERVRG